MKDPAAGFEIPFKPKQKRGPKAPFCIYAAITFSLSERGIETGGI